MQDEFSFRTLATNGIHLRVALEDGEGPLVILVHGWPELWYSWRHQIRPIAEAGYRVAVPDMRGYGGSTKPLRVESYDMAHMMADIVGLIDRLSEETAILVGHDWGAPICWNTAALHPDRVAAVTCLSVPYRRRREVSLIELWRRLYKDKFFYQLYFQEEGVAEAEFEADVRTALRKIYYSGSGKAAPAHTWTERKPDSTMLGPLVDPDPFPAWLTEHDLDYFVENFEAGGFRGPINRYRNQDKDFIDLPEIGTARIRQPSAFMAGSEDVVRRFVHNHDGYANVDELCDDMRLIRIINGAGHWVQQEAPETINAALLQFLATLD